MDKTPRNLKCFEVRKSRHTPTIRYYYQVYNLQSVEANWLAGWIRYWAISSCTQSLYLLQVFLTCFQVNYLILHLHWYTILKPDNTVIDYPFLSSLDSMKPGAKSYLRSHRHKQEIGNFFFLLSFILHYTCIIC